MRLFLWLQEKRLVQEEEKHLKKIEELINYVKKVRKNKVDIKKTARLILAVIVCQATGLIGSLFTFPAIGGWYVALQKPWFGPPNFVFAPAWITLYTLMGIAAFLVWEKGIQRKDVRSAMLFFGLQLGLNSIWSIIFFGFRNPMLAFIEIVFLWLAIGITTRKFYIINKRAAYLMLPYLAWVSFAALLNLSIWLLN